MPTVAELLIALLTDHPLTRSEKRELALIVLQLVRQLREAQPAGDAGE